jgi:hypothetical protein
MNAFIFLMLLAVPLCFALSNQLSNADKNQLIADIQSIINLGDNYFNINGSCWISSDLTSTPLIFVNNIVELESIDILRATFPKNQMVIIILNASDSTTISGSFVPAFQTSSTINWYSNMSCSYIKGLGYSRTSILYQPQASVQYLNQTPPAIKVQKVSDFFLLDITIDRVNSSFRIPGLECQLALNFPSLISSASSIVKLQNCIGMYPQWRFYSIGSFHYFICFCHLLFTF